MTSVLGKEAAKPNPALVPLSGIIGTWTTTGTHPLVPGKTFHGRTSFAWLDGGAFLAMRSEIDEPEIPSGIAIIGTDDSHHDCRMLYFDERNVSRIYQVSFETHSLKWWRDAPDISQSFELTIAADGRSMSAHGKYSKNRGPWEPDLQLHFSRQG